MFVVDEVALGQVSYRVEEEEEIGDEGKDEKR
jgi:hypothetical protein